MNRMNELKGLINSNNDKISVGNGKDVVVLFISIYWYEI